MVLPGHQTRKPHGAPAYLRLSLGRDVCLFKSDDHQRRPTLPALHQPRRRNGEWERVRSNDFAYRSRRKHVYQRQRGGFFLRRCNRALRIPRQESFAVAGRSARHGHRDQADTFTFAADGSISGEIDLLPAGSEAATICTPEHRVPRFALARNGREVIGEHADQARPLGIAESTLWWSTGGRRPPVDHQGMPRGCTRSCSARHVRSGEPHECGSGARARSSRTIVGTAPRRVRTRRKGHRLLVSDPSAGHRLRIASRPAPVPASIRRRSAFGDVGPSHENHARGRPARG